MNATLTRFRRRILRSWGAWLVFLSSSVLAPAASYEWGFTGNLDASLGNGLFESADSQSQTLTTFGTTPVG